MRRYVVKFADYTEIDSVVSIVDGNTKSQKGIKGLSKWEKL